MCLTSLIIQVNIKVILTRPTCLDPCLSMFQTGLSGLDPEERLVRLSRNMCLLLTAILHFIHGMTDPVLMSLSASHVLSVRRHLPVLLVSLALFVLPVALSYALWHHYALNTWLFAVTAFCVELCLKVITKLTIIIQ